jgi:DNA-directed RNA polymerase specialized sigma24 family protein
MTTATRESLRHIRLHGREVPTSEPDEGPADEPPEPEGISEERGRALWRAFTTLSDRCQALLRLLVVVDERPSFETISSMFDMPIGSIGPTRMRCLEKLRAALELDPAFEGGAH